MDIELYGQDHYLAAASGAIPAILAMLYFDYLDRKRPEPLRMRYGVVLVGMLSVIPVLILAQVLDTMLGAEAPAPDTYEGAAYVSFGVAAGLEEACKMSAVFLVVWYSRHFDERMDGIVYGARAGLGFALVENCLYIYKAVIDDQLVAVWILRAVLAVPGHAIWTGMMGYYAARRRFDHDGPGLIGGYLIAVLMHGTYDFAIFVGIPLRADGQETLAGVLMVVPLVVSIMGWVMITRMSRNALRRDDAAAARAAAGPGSP